MSIPWKGDLLTLQARIYRARKAAGWTQADAGEVIGMSERSYRDWEGGKKDLPAASLFQLAAALGVRVFDPEGENRKETSGSVSDVLIHEIRTKILGVAA